MSVESSSLFTVEPHPNPTSAERRAELMANPGFGKVFTDHMVTIRHSAEKGWHDARIGPRQAFDFDPSTMVLHYALEIFEGLKAYARPDGGAALFRPDANARRFVSSARRLAMPELPEPLFLESVRELVRIDRDWVPTAEGASLYLRPFMVGSEIALGTRPSTEALYCVIASPVGAYFSGGNPAVSLWVTETYTRAAPGGTGAAKCGGNYAASLAAQAEGAREGCEQVVFLDAVERRWIEELGGMNIFFVFEDGSLRTPPLTGTILPGVTRDSIIHQARSLGLSVSEEPYSIDAWQADALSGRVTESFACGTAAVITPIGHVKGRNRDFSIGGGNPGPVTTRLKAALTDLQFGRAPDPFGWIERPV